MIKLNSILRKTIPNITNVKLKFSQIIKNLKNLHYERIIHSNCLSKTYYTLYSFFPLFPYNNTKQYITHVIIMSNVRFAFSIYENARIQHVNNEKYGKYFSYF